MANPEDRGRLLGFLASLDLPAGRSFDEDRLELDSLGLLRVVLYLEETYAIRLSSHRIEPDDLRSVAGILSIIGRFATGGPPA